MPREKFREKPFYFKLFSSVIRTASLIVVVIIIIFAIRFLLETPFYRMFDGISILGIILMALILIAVICLIIAWFKSTAGGVSALFPTIAYIVVDSIEQSAFSVSAISIILLSLALLFILEGALKRYVERDRLADILGPKIDRHDGPDLTNLHL